MMKRRRKVPVSNLRASLGERIRARDKSADLDWESEFKVQRPSLLRLIFDQMHRHLKLKISIAVVVVFVCALLQHVDIPRIRSVEGALRYVTDHNLDLHRAAGNYIPAFKLAWQEHNLPGFDPDPVMDFKSVLPFEGTLIGRYGMGVDPDSGLEMMRYGIDLTASEGTQVRAVLAGRVEEIFLLDGMSCLRVGHDPEWETLYQGLGDVTPAPGDLVQEGQVLGILAVSDEWGTPCLHFELRYRGQPVEPPAEWVKQFENG